MPSLDSLPADQRAVLQLVLQRGHSYDEIAKLLSIDRAAVRDRALSALDALGPQTGVPSEQRALITDYLLGQLPPRVSNQVSERLAGSASARAWAQVLASELAPLASGPLPDLPAESADARDREPPPTGESAPEQPAADQRAEAGSPAASSAGAERARERPRSRLGGAILLAAAALVAIAVVLVVVLVSNGSSTKHGPSAAHSAPASTPTTSTSTTASTSAHVVAQINLNSPAAGSRAAGIADVLMQGSVTGIAIAAQGLAPNSKRPPNAYAVWLSNSASDSHMLGFVNPGVGSNGRLQTAGALPSNAARYKQLIVTLETDANPHGPGRIVLRGPLNLR